METTILGLEFPKIRLDVANFGSMGGYRRLALDASIMKFKR